MRPQPLDPRFQPQTHFHPLASPSLPAADVVDFRGYFKVETFAHGSAIYRPGMPADKVFLLRSGRVRLLKQGKGKSRSVLSILKPGDLFGEVLRPDGSVMDDLAVSSGKCEVWSIEGRDFRALLEARPALAVDVIRALNERVRQLRQRVLGLTRKDVPARLAEMLIALAQAHGERLGPGNELCLHGITQQDLADLVGASRSFVSTLINKMKRDGLLANQGRLLVLKDEAGVDNLAQREK
jgi:CRP/FNR family transcriptional regulator, cyclic AMP receptor protein